MSARDADQARAQAAAMLDRAAKISEAVDLFHSAADRMDTAQREANAAAADRVSALRAMRDAGVTLSEMHTLTGLSASRIQALVRNGNEHPANANLTGSEPEAARTDADLVASPDAMA